jgi:hypothetical protein
VFFRAENWQASLEILKGMSGMNGAVLDYRLGDTLSFLKSWVTFQGTGIGSFSSLYGLVWIALAAALALFVPNIYQALKMPQRDGILQIDIKRIKKKYGIILLAVTSLLAVIALSRIGAPSEFLYFDF